jgi:hypothetical protein
MSSHFSYDIQNNTSSLDLFVTRDSWSVFHEASTKQINEREQQKDILDFFATKYISS